MLPHDIEQKIKDIVSGEVVDGIPGNLIAARNLLCAGFTPDRTVKTAFESKLLIKEKQALILADWAKQQGCWLTEPPSSSQYLTRGGESQVFHDDDHRHVIKLNKADYYATWLEYLDSLSIHNILFPDTQYVLAGFTGMEGDLFAVLRQPFIFIEEQASLDDIKSWLEHNGFKLKKRNDYFHPALGLILEDMHDENVLYSEGVLFFIDTVFYIVHPADA